MCLTCGCMLSHDDHGNPDYLTIEDFEKSQARRHEPGRNLVATVEVAKQETGHEHR